MKNILLIDDDVLMKNILLIDDDKKTPISLLEDLHDTHGYEVDSVTKAADALEKLKDKKYDAIILDIMMPIPDDWTDDEKDEAQLGLKTGAVLFRKIREVFPNMPILILTARESPSIDKNTTYIRKPESIAVIVQHLKEIMNESI